MFPCLARPRRSSLSPNTEALLCCEQAHTSLLLAGSNFETYSAGGGGGTAWADDVANRAVSGLQVWSDGDGMRQIQIEYTGGVWGAKHGSEGGSISYWTVPQGQTVTSVSVWVQNKSTVRAIQFTSGTTSSPVLGKTTNFTKATYTPATAGDALMAVTGRAGGAVDQLSFTFGPATALTPIVFSKTFGGNGGGAFADNLNVSIPAKLTGFTGSADWKLQSFTASFGGVSAAKHGGNSGSEVTPFLVPEGDYVTQVKVYYDSGSVYGLQFFTKKNVSSALFGGTNGSSSSTEMVSGTKEAPVLAVIVGRSGGAIDQIQFGFTPLVADKYVLKNIAYGIPVVQEPTPVSLGEASARNLSSQDQEASLTITTSITETSSWEESNSVTIGVSTSVEAEAGVVFASAKTTFTMSTEWSGSWTTGGEHSKTVEYSVSQTVSVAPGKCITGTLRGSMAKATIPWTATKVPVLNDQEVPDGATSATGVLKCATVGKYVLEWTEASA